MRPLALALVVATLGVGGVALAQPELVVDPWSAATEVDSWFGQAPHEQPETSKADPVLVNPWQPPRDVERAPREKRVEVFPVAPAANAPQKSGPVVSPVAPMVIDPWAPVGVSEIPSLDKQSGQRSIERRSPWSGRMIEVVDPWGRVPSFDMSKHFELIVDPWAR